MADILKTGARHDSELVWTKLPYPRAQRRWAHLRKMAPKGLDLHEVKADAIDGLGFGVRYHYLFDHDRWSMYYSFCVKSVMRALTVTMLAAHPSSSVANRNSGDGIGAYCQRRPDAL